MMTWLRRIRRAVLLAVAWGLAWAPLGVIIGLIVHADGSMDEPWVAVGAYPGFLSALVFSLLVALAARRHTLDELSFPRAGVLGAASGLLVMLIPFTLLGTPNTEHPFWRLRMVIIAAVAVLSAVSAIASVLLARMARQRALGAAA